MITRPFVTHRPAFIGDGPIDSTMPRGLWRGRHVAEPLQVTPPGVSNGEAMNPYQPVPNLPLPSAPGGLRDWGVGFTAPPPHVPLDPTIPAQGRAR